MLSTGEAWPGIHDVYVALVLISFKIPIESLGLLIGNISANAEWLARVNHVGVEVVVSPQLPTSFKCLCRWCSEVF
jgi:hypothetical protein